MEKQHEMYITRKIIFFMHKPVNEELLILPQHLLFRDKLQQQMIESPIQQEGMKGKKHF